MANMILHKDAIIRDEPKLPQFQEFPQMMTHPSYDPGSIGQEVTDSSGFKHYVNGKSARYAPVMVNSEDDRLYYESKGYVSQGKSDGAAFDRAVAAAAQAKIPSGYVPQEYPKWAGGKLVNNAEEEAQALADRRVQLGLEEAAGTAAPNTTPDTVEANAPEIDDARISAVENDLAALKQTVVSGFDELKAMLANLTGQPKQAAPVVKAEVEAEPTPIVFQAVEPAPLTRQQKAAITRKQKAMEAANNQAA